MPSNRKLQLKRESLTELSPEEITRVVGGGVLDSQFTDCAKFTCAADGCGATLAQCIPTWGCATKVTA